MSEYKAVEKVALIIGASSGIGAVTAPLFEKGGYTVYAASRRAKAPYESPSLIPLKMDVTNEQSVISGVSSILEAKGRIDVLVYAAGNGIAGPVEGTSVEDALSQFDVNFFGCLKALNAVLPHMRKVRRGSIVLIGSVGGRVTVPFQTLYSSSKAALAALSDGLRAELKQFNINVTLVEPGDVNTAFPDARRVLNAEDEYKAEFKSALYNMEHDERTGMKPEVVAKAIYKAAEKANPPSRKVVDFGYRVLTFLLRLIPACLVERIVRSMYIRKS